ncbi:hypothetical protein B005_5496 [Nocardiopsis alba ATCC BAA-2165]|uniref:Uncharacterized protein n=1 Tax=Nocardiopsis alba (strain ATCC BAA-2165 / BE74) TaxID=1205910 RepID=J7L0M1_NOCAA|nr:hypothetical protein B005_5496 [Nocardiopsis alba ATCC BAA-2165]
MGEQRVGVDGAVSASRDRTCPGRTWVVPGDPVDGRWIVTTVCGLRDGGDPR